MNYVRLSIFLLLGIATQACATKMSGGLESLPTCVAQNVGQISLRGNDGLPLPQLSDSKVLSLGDIQKIVSGMPESEKNKIIAVTRDIAADISRSQLRGKDYQLFHDRIFQAFSAKAADAYDAAKCGPKTEVGEQIFVIVTDWLMVPFEKSPLRNSRNLKYDLSSLVRTAVVLEINGVPYKFDELVDSLR